MKVLIQSIIPIVAITVSGCQTVEQQSLDEDASRQVVSFSDRVNGFGIYRLSVDQYGDLHALPLCPDDMANKELLGRRDGKGLPDVNGAIETDISKKSSDKLTDQKPLDSINISLKPSLKREILNGNIDASLTFDFAKISGARRVVEGYSAEKKKLYVTAGQDTERLTAEYIKSSVNGACADLLNNDTLAKIKGVPVFVYAIAVADKIYTQGAKFLPILKAEVTSGKIKDSSVSGTIDLNPNTKLEEASNVVFGYKYFIIGAKTYKTIPEIKLDPALSAKRY
ncbi:hypothetical protein [Pararhizobium sp.]|uniref:hypothetical protein n=1 Tax=Pararhizobium sp. TaxID=1977563 RepID=UPI003D09CAC4